MPIESQPRSERAPSGLPGGGGPGQPRPSEQAGVAGSGAHGRRGLLQSLPGTGKSKQLRLNRETAEEGRILRAKGLGTRAGAARCCPGASGHVDSWGGGRFWPESFCPLQMLLKKAAEEPPPPEGKGHVLEVAGSSPQGHQAPSVMAQLSGLEHVGPCHFLGRASGPGCFPFVKK